ncbi:hypothetical protein K492DRAFT_194204 [Lichtheimia hyalospora FSU 10163]|nr:hypothetical protein K492DRAFT_194204 [Lichtheimia hyalospora FSU 10163]
MAKQKTSTTTKKSTAKALSPYNIYMKEELARFKAANPGVKHQDAFKTVAKNWATSPENPKNKKDT